MYDIPRISSRYLLNDSKILPKSSASKTISLLILPFVYLPVVAQIGQRPCSAVTGGKFAPFCIRTALWSGASTREIRSLWDGWSWKRRRNWSASDLDRCGRCRPFLKAVAMTTSSASRAPEKSITSSPPVYKNSCNSAFFSLYSFGLNVIRLKISTLTQLTWRRFKCL